MSGAWRRAGFRKGLDGRRTPKFLRSVTRDNAPPDAKPLVVGSASPIYIRKVIHLLLVIRENVKFQVAYF